MQRKKLEPKRPLPVETPGNDVELASFEHHLRIDKHNLDEELMSQPQFFHEICDRLALAVSQRDQQKDQLETVEAELYLDARQAAEDKEEKCTETQLKARVQVSDDRKAAFRKLIETEREVARWQGLKESYKDRSFMLRELCELQRDAYFAQNSVTGADRRDTEVVKAIRTDRYRERRETKR